MDTRHFTDYARDRGTAVHSACEYYDQGDLDMESLDPVLVPFVETYQRFLTETGAKVLEIEKEVVVEDLGYVGHYDRVYDIDAYLWLTDIKSGAPANWHGVQLAAYRNGGGLQYRRAGLYLNPPSYKFVPYTDRADFQIFKAALTIYQTRQAWKLIP